MEPVEKEMRIFPRKKSDLKPHPRVQVLRKDTAGFTIVKVRLKPTEGVCWRCGWVAFDPEHNLQICPACGQDFNN